MNIKIDALNYYGATKKYQLHFPALQDDIAADVVIIGGGFSGINTALELAEQGITNVVVLEARHLGYGRHQSQRQARSWPALVTISKR